jgi:hypothetical protein
VVETMTVDGSPIFVDQITDIEAAVLGLRPPRISLDESRRLTATLVALSASARRGCRVEVSEA